MNIKVLGFNNVKHQGFIDRNCSKSQLTLHQSNPNCLAAFESSANGVLNEEANWLYPQIMSNPIIVVFSKPLKLNSSLLIITQTHI